MNVKAVEWVKFNYLVAILPQVPAEAVVAAATASAGPWGKNAIYIIAINDGQFYLWVTLLL